jgi:hypothetical protein
MFCGTGNGRTRHVVFIVHDEHDASPPEAWKFMLNNDIDDMEKKILMEYDNLDSKYINHPNRQAKTTYDEKTKFTEFLQVIKELQYVDDAMGVPALKAFIKSKARQYGNILKLRSRQALTPVQENLKPVSPLLPGMTSVLCIFCSSYFQLMCICTV